MSSWKSGRGFQWQPVKLWWTPGPRVFRECRRIMATQNINTLGSFTWGVLSSVASGSDINGCVLSYFEVTVNLSCYSSCTLTTAKCHFFFRFHYVSVCFVNTVLMLCLAFKKTSCFKLRFLIWWRWTAGGVRTSYQRHVLCCHKRVRLTNIEMLLSLSKYIQWLWTCPQYAETLSTYISS